jgi:pseudouridine synthase
VAAERLQKVIAHAGLCSRRTAETWIEEGRVAVNGVVVRELGTTVDPARDTVSVDGKPISAEAHEYWVLHKPKGVVTTMDDPQGRPTVRSLIDTNTRVYPVGRLDFFTTGLLLLTNDGSLADKLTHPRHGHRKVYHVLTSGYPTDEALERLRQGPDLEDGPTAPAEVRPLHTTRDGAWLEVVLREGRKRQLRRMIAAIGHEVVHLRRVAFGPIQLGRLKEGESRQLNAYERRALGIPAPPGPSKGGGRGRGGGRRDTRRSGGRPRRR